MNGNYGRGYKAEINQRVEEKALGTFFGLICRKMATGPFVTLILFCVYRRDLSKKSPSRKKQGRRASGSKKLRV